jgi:hypothetical protein
MLDPQSKIEIDSEQFTLLKCSATQFILVKGEYKYFTKGQIYQAVINTRTKFVVMNLDELDKTLKSKEYQIVNFEG